MNNWMRIILYFVNITLYIGLVILWIALPTELTLNFAGTIFNLCFTVLIVYSDRERFALYYNSSKFRNLTSTLASVFLVFCIIALVNYLGFKHPKQIDLSKDELNSLTKKTREVLDDSSDRKLHFKVFSRKEERAAMLALLELYRAYRSDIVVDPIDIELRPDLVKKYGIVNTQTIVLESDKRKEVVMENSELGVTNAILRINRKRDPLVYYSIGHQELDISSQEKNGLARFFGHLQKASFDVKLVELAVMTQIPEEVDALIVWGPKSGFMDNELKVLTDYLKRGGRVLIALDPDLNDDRVSGLRDMLSKRGLIISNNLVIDTKSFVSGSKGTVPLVKNFDRDHPITKTIQGNVFFPLASSLANFNEDKFKWHYLATTSFYPDSWAENTPTEILTGDIRFNEETDTKGPIALAAAWESSKNSSRIVAFGNSSLISNSYEKYGQNYAFVLNALNWLIDKKTLASFNLPIGKPQPIFVTPMQVGVVFWFSVVGVPFVMLFLAFLFYRRRRKL